ncbi:group 1 truncated hemoglobin [Mariprofundus sp. EBB-1]|uniref:group I truncated hemoglobin n=1 Tax=Mariprofundus sp. EBB-1 TaxID=2650971 RepID=UPI00351134AB
MAGAADKSRASEDEEKAKAPAEKSLYDQLGGAAAIDAAVNIFYRRVLSDAYIKVFFEGTDMTKQAAKQKAFLTMVFGGPNNYTGMDMRVGHKHLVEKMGLDDSHFEHVLAHLRSTLAELGVGEAKVAEIIAIADSVRDDVLNR